MNDYKILMSKVATRGELSEDCCSGVSEVLIELKNNQKFFFDYDFDIKEDRMNIYISQKSIFDSLFKQSLDQSTKKDACVILIYGNDQPFNIPEYFQESDIGIIPDILKMLTALLVSPYIAKGIYEEMFDKRHNHNTQLKSVTELFAEIKKGLQK